MTDQKRNIKIIGRRVTGPHVDWNQVNDFLKLVIELNRKNKFIPKGIHKFINHSDNDEWLITVLTNR